MNYRDLISSRKSVREYNDLEIKKEIIDQIKLFAYESQKLMPEVKIEFKIFNNTNNEISNKLQNLAGYGGLMIEAPHYFMIFSEQKENYIENSGYLGESVILKATELEVSSCWITFKNSKDILNKLEIKTDKELTAIIALGYESPVNRKKIVDTTKVGENYSYSNLEILKNNLSDRFGVEHFVYLEKWGNTLTYEALDERALLDAFNYARMAPSNLNRQPWRFIIDSGKILLFVRNDEFTNSYESKIDAGIVMLYFSAIVKSTLFDTSWCLENINLEKYNVPSDYKYIGYINI